MKFGNLNDGDMFNTKEARWVKTSANNAIVVMSGVCEIGFCSNFACDDEVIPLFTRAVSKEAVAGVADIRRLKEITEDKIKLALSDFTQQTSIDVCWIDLDVSESINMGGQKKHVLYGVHINVEI